MTLVRCRDTYNPFTNLVPMKSLFDRFFDDSLTPFGATGALTRWHPAVDIAEKDDGISLTIELPGIEQKDIEVEVHDGTLTIKGEKKDETKVDEGNYHRVERTYGSCERSFALRADVKEDAIKATFKNGVLEILLPKTEESKPKKVAVEIKGE